MSGGLIGGIGGGLDGGLDFGLMMSLVGGMVFSYLTVRGPPPLPFKIVQNPKDRMCWQVGYIF